MQEFNYLVLELKKKFFYYSLFFQIMSKRNYVYILVSLGEGFKL